MSRYRRKDAFHQRAKREGYRSRAAYKLAEIADRHALLAPGARVADLGCWPGGWLQVAAERIGPTGRVVGVDLAAIDPPLELRTWSQFRETSRNPRCCKRILDALGGPADVLLCDAAPKLTGIRDADRAREEALLEAVAAALPVLLRPGGDLLCKLLDSPEADAIARRPRRRLPRARSAASRGDAQGQRRALSARARPPDEERGEIDVRSIRSRFSACSRSRSGRPTRRGLRRLWVELLGLRVEGTFRSESENVDEDIAVAGAGPFRVEVDLMQPVDPEKRPRVHDPALNHIGLWVDDLAAAVAWLDVARRALHAGRDPKGRGGLTTCASSIRRAIRPIRSAARAC